MEPIPSTPAPPTHGRGLALDRWCSQFKDFLLAGDDARGWALLRDALASGVPAADVYVEVVAGALESVGEEWMLGRVDVAAEHIATATSGRLLARLAASIDAVSSRGAVVVATPPGEHHAMPVFVLAEVLRLAGFSVVNLGADVPLASLVAAAQRTDGLVAVCIGGTVVGLDAMAEAVAAVRQSLPDVEVLAGGQAVPDQRSAVAVGASGWAADARDVPGLLGQDAAAPPVPSPAASTASTASIRASDDYVRRLQHITDAALAHLNLDELIAEVTAQTVSALDADDMEIVLCDGDEPLAGLAGRIAERRGPTVIDDVADGTGSVVGVPLVVDGEVIGAAYARSRVGGRFGEGDARFFQLVADRVALAIDRARLFEAEREARTLAEASQRRLAFLTNVGEALARSLDWHELLDILVDRTVPFLADWCAVDFIHDDGSLRCAAASHRDPALEPLVRQLHDSRPPRLAEARGVGRVVRDGEPLFWPVVTPDGMAAVARTPERMAMFRTLAPCSTMILPLEVRGSILGAVTFVHSTSGRRYGEGDVDLASELVRRVGVALDNARLFTEASAVARTLQASLLPPHLPDIPGAELDGLYEPGGEGSEMSTAVGGDFYDVFATEPGDWALVVGDVCGKGAEAAAVTALGRYTLRAAAMQARRPSRVLHVLNEAMLRSETTRPFLTVAYARLQFLSGAVRATVGCAGHPMPMVLRASGKVEAVGRPGMLLGCFADIHVEDIAVDLLPGDALVLYTDGVEEARDADGRLLGVDGVKAVLADAAGSDAAEINRRLHAAATSRRAGGPADDVVILTLRLL